MKRYRKEDPKTKQLCLSAARKKNKGINLKRWRETMKNEAKATEGNSMNVTVAAGSTSTSPSYECSQAAAGTAADAMRTVHFAMEQQSMQEIEKLANSSSSEEPGKIKSSSIEEDPEVEGTSDVSSIPGEAATYQEDIAHPNVHKVAVSNGSSSEPLERISCEENVDFSEEGSRINKSLQDLNGRRISNMKNVFSGVFAMARHNPMCSLEDIIYTGEHRQGLISHFMFKCLMCCMTFNICSEPKDQHMNVNLSAVSAANSIGTGFAQTEEFFAALDMPFMNKNTYAKHEASLGEYWTKTAQNEMEKAIEEEKRIALEEGRIDEDNNALLTVVVDGAWAKRSYRSNYNSLSGVAAIVGLRTRKVLFMAVRNRYCSMCAYHKGKVIEHKCSKNWDGSSSGMEADIILEGFASSIEMYGVKYIRYVGDGDTNVFMKLQEAMPYAPKTIEKVECKNHILRNYMNGLKDSTFLARKKSGTPEMRELIKRNYLRLRTAVSKAIDYRSKEKKKTLDEKITNLRRDILNSPYHVFGEHTNCFDEEGFSYFCKEERREENNFISDLTKQGLFSIIMQATNRVADHSTSLIHNSDNNCVELYNSRIAKLSGGKRVNFSKRFGYATRCAGAVVSHNSGSIHGILHKTIYNKSPGVFTKKLEKKRKLIREKYRNKKPRAKKRLFFSRQEENEYGPGIQDNNSDKSFLDSKNAFMKDLTMSSDKIKKLERQTLAQANSQLWILERRKRLTSSNFGQVCKMRATTDKIKTAKKMLINNISNLQAIRWGRNKEALAIAAFSEKMKMNVRKCGLFIDINDPYLAASPDGLLDENGLIEVKCPFAAIKSCSIELAVKEGKIGFLGIRNSSLFLKETHNYYYQIQGQLHITGREFCYLIVWTPQDLFYQKIDKSDKFWSEKMIDKLKNFYNEALLPILLDEF